MNDRELLEMAARAAGIEIGFDGIRCQFRIKLAMGFLGENWNPLADDGDAFRLASMLGMSVDLGSCIIEFGDDNGLEWDGSDGDICHARRAIVRAAAEIHVTSQA